MQITRLDKIVENNVAYSQQKANAEQMMLCVLQDMSETLAMIYDRLCGEEPIIETSNSVKQPIQNGSSEAIIIHPSYLLEHKNEVLFSGKPILLERYGFNGIIKAFVIGIAEESATNDTVLTVEITDIPNGHMNLYWSDYGLLWRIWNVRPTDELMEASQWERFKN